MTAQSAVGRIAKKEMLEVFRDGRFRVLSVIILTLLVTSLALGWRRYTEVNQQHEAARKATRQNWLAQGVKNPHSAAHYGVYAFKPRNVLSFVDQGVDPFTGVAVWLEAHKQDDFKYRPIQDANALARFGDLTAAAVLQILAPLLIVLLSFSTFAGEREQGTLRQLLAIGLPREQIAAGKALGLAGALGLVLIPAALVGASMLILMGEPGTFASTAGRLLVSTLSYTLYFAAFLGICLAVSASAKSTRTALVVLLAFWIANCLVAPRALTDIARRIYPTPSAYEFAGKVAHDLEYGLNGDSSASKRAKELQTSILRQYGVKDVDELPVSFRGISLQAGEDHGDQVFDKRYAELWDAFERQSALQQIAGIAAPMLAVRSVSMGLAGTDFAQHRDFAVAAETYRRQLIKAINDDITKNGTGDGVYVRGDDLWRSIPEFQYVAPDLKLVLSRQLAPLLILVFWALAGALAAFWSARHVEAI